MLCHGAANDASRCTPLTEAAAAAVLAAAAATFTRRPNAVAHALHLSVVAERKQVRQGSKGICTQRRSRDCWQRQSIQLQLSKSTPCSPYAPAVVLWLACEVLLSSSSQKDLSDCLACCLPHTAQRCRTNMRKEKITNPLMQAIVAS